MIKKFCALRNLLSPRIVLVLLVRVQVGGVVAELVQQWPARRRLRPVV